MSQLNMIVDFLKTSYKFDAFQEPRGVMRIFQFVFAIWAFFSTSDFKTTLTMDCDEKIFKKAYEIEYPFEFAETICRRKPVGGMNTTLLLSVDVSSDAQFFVITAVLAMLYAMFIIFVYLYLDDMYKTKPEFPMADFALTTILAIFWLSGSAAWSNGASALKTITDPAYITNTCTSCAATVSSFSDLNISLMIGFLNFFLWGSDLWFLYKETIWFQARNIPMGYPQPQV